MIKSIFAVLLLLNFINVHAKQEQFTTVNLKYIDGQEIISILKPLTDKAISISEQNNTLIIKGSKKQSKNIVKLINKIDTPASPLTLEFISSKRKINFKQQRNTFQSRSNINQTSQSMSIKERQWVTLNTGISIPISERKRAVDGSETQSIRYKKINRSYLFKVHEFNGQSVIQVGINSSRLSNNISGAIEHTKLDTTVIGKTGEWLEIAASKNITQNGSDNIYSTNRINKNRIHLYIKITK